MSGAAADTLDHGLVAEFVDETDGCHLVVDLPAGLKVTHYIWNIGAGGLALVPRDWVTRHCAGCVATVIVRVLSVRRSVAFTNVALDVKIQALEEEQVSLHAM